MPSGTIPFENKEEFEAEVSGRFYLRGGRSDPRLVLFAPGDLDHAVRHQDLPKGVFKNVVVLEFILDKEGKKMSKHKGNVVDPFATVAKYGADPVRWYLVSNSNLWVPTKFR